MVVRYMGTKRHMAGYVRAAIETLQPTGRVVDLFSGMGSVADSLQDTASVVTNDALSFTAALSRARFTGAERETSPQAAAERLRASFIRQLDALTSLFAAELSREEEVLRGSRDDLADYMSTAAHVGNSPIARQSARAAANAADNEHYKLAALYFSAGYLSLRQAIEVDALRAAIDADLGHGERDWLIGAWIAAVSRLVNAPGHTAQYLKPNSDSSRERIARTWRRPMWSEFEKTLDAVGQVGSPAWRSRNTVYVGDALDLVTAGELQDIGLVYADPPYTKDQYSRYYHLYETLYRYDFPDSSGAGRNRSDRFTTGFSLKSAVVASFHDLCRGVARMRVPLVISYPSSGLLHDAGVRVESVAAQHFTRVEVHSVAARHSTMGASNGESTKHATEHLYVCTR